MIGNYVRDYCVARHHQQVEALSKKTMFSASQQFSDECISNCCVAVHCVSHPAVLFIYSYWDREKSTVEMIWLGYSLVCPATLHCNWDRMTFSGIMVDRRSVANEHITLTLHYGLCLL